jgi:putative spermidine/putrescine transport system permease protein
MPPRFRPLLLATIPLLLLLAGFELAPLLAVLVSSVYRGGHLSFGNYAEIVTSSYQRGAYFTSIWLSVLTTLIGLGLALPVARLLQRMPGRVQSLMLTYANIGANFTGFPLAFAFIIMFGLSGTFTLILQRLGLIQDLNIYSTGGLVLVYSYFQVCLGILVLFPALRALTPEMDEAAAMLGVPRWRFWWRIGLPVLRPSLIGAAILLFANAMGTYATAFALAGGNANLVTIHIGELVAGDVYSDPNLADALAVILVVTLILPIAIQQVWASRRPRDDS